MPIGCFQSKKRQRCKSDPLSLALILPEILFRAAKRLQEEPRQFLSLGVIQAIEPVAKATHIYLLCVCAKEPVPEGKDIGIIRVCLCADPGMMNLVHVWRDDD